MHSFSHSVGENKSDEGDGIILLDHWAYITVYGERIYFIMKGLNMSYTPPWKHGG